jgi:hypothetical protein
MVMSSLTDMEEELCCSVLGGGMILINKRTVCTEKLIIKYCMVYSNKPEF